MTTTVQRFHNPACSDAPEKTSAQISTMRPIRSRANTTFDRTGPDGRLSWVATGSTNSGCFETGVIPPLSNDQLTDAGPSGRTELPNGVVGPPFGGAPGSAFLSIRRTSLMLYGGLRR